MYAHNYAYSEWKPKHFIQLVNIHIYYSNLITIGRMKVSILYIQKSKILDHVFSLITNHSLIRTCFMKFFIIWHKIKSSLHQYLIISLVVSHQNTTSILLNEIDRIIKYHSIYSSISLEMCFNLLWYVEI